MERQLSFTMWLSSAVTESSASVSVSVKPTKLDKAIDKLIEILADRKTFTVSAPRPFVPSVPSTDPLLLFLADRRKYKIHAPKPIVYATTLCITGQRDQTSQ